MVDDWKLVLRQREDQFVAENKTQTKQLKLGRESKEWTDAKQKLNAIYGKK